MTTPGRGRIPLDLVGTPEVEIDAAPVARGLGLSVADFRELMESRRITLLCERGTGADAGLYRASFYHGTRRVRIVVDGEGRPVGEGLVAEEMPPRRGPVGPPRG